MFRASKCGAQDSNPVLPASRTPALNVPAPRLPLQPPGKPDCSVDSKQGALGGGSNTAQRKPGLSGARLNSRMRHKESTTAESPFSWGLCEKESEEVNTTKLAKCPASTAVFSAASCPPEADHTPGLLALCSLPHAPVWDSSSSSFQTFPLSWPLASEIADLQPQTRPYKWVSLADTLFHHFELVPIFKMAHRFDLQL